MSKIKNDAIRCLQDEAQALLDLIPQLTDDFDKAIELTYQCKGKLIITGVGKSGHIGAKIAATLASTGTPSFFINPLDAFHGDLGMVTADDVVLAISYSGQTDELLRFIPLLVKRKIPLIGMSGNPNSLLAQWSNYHLNIAVKKEACPLNLAPTSSTTAMLAMGDAIACALINRRNFQANDFAQFHPGGSLGKRLLMRVKDVMRTDDLPIVSSQAKIGETLLEMSKARLSLAIIVDNGKIEGIVSDGDVRRAFQKYDNQEVLNTSIENIINRNPRIIGSSESIMSAATIFKEHNVHTLVVIDNGVLIGVVESYQCML
ncbi:arabinose-5-phosphate isomerase [Bacteroidia bacterium]|nr:arabinose-5-phosphate isomerase [Bacteroidia bacterium]